MKTLFELSLASFCALAWASFSVARHVRGHSSVPSAETLDFVPRTPRKRTGKARRSGRKSLRVAA